MVKDFKTELEKEWYLLTPSNVYGKIEKNNVLSYNDSQTIEVFYTEEKMNIKLKQLNLLE